VPTSVEGEVAVLQEFRGKGLVLWAHVAMGRELYERGVALRMGFATHELHARFYTKRFGNLSIPTLNTRYRKNLRASAKLAHAVCLYADAFSRNLIGRRLVRREPLTVALRVEGYSPVVVRIGQDVAVLLAPRGVQPDVLVSLSNRMASAVKGSWKTRLYRIPRYLFKGDVRVRGMTRTIGRLVGWSSRGPEDQR
jgi:hypothetical protein